MGAQHSSFVLTAHSSVTPNGQSLYKAVSDRCVRQLVGFCDNTADAERLVWDTVLHIRCRRGTEQWRESVLYPRVVERGRSPPSPSFCYVARKPVAHGGALYTLVSDGGTRQTDLREYHRNPRDIDGPPWLWSAMTLIYSYSRHSYRDIGRQHKIPEPRKNKLFDEIVVTDALLLLWFSLAVTTNNNRTLSMVRSTLSSPVDLYGTHALSFISEDAKLVYLDNNDWLVKLGLKRVTHRLLIGVSASQCTASLWHTFLNNSASNAPLNRLYPRNENVQLVDQTFIVGAERDDTLDNDNWIYWPDVINLIDECDDHKYLILYASDNQHGFVFIITPFIRGDEHRLMKRRRINRTYDIEWTVVNQEQGTGDDGSRILYIVDPHTPLDHHLVTDTQRTSDIKRSVSSILNANSGSMRTSLTVRTCKNPDHAERVLYTQGLAEAFGKLDFDKHPNSFGLEGFCSLLSRLFIWKLCERLEGRRVWAGVDDICDRIETLWFETFRFDILVRASALVMLLASYSEHAWADGPWVKTTKYPELGLS